MPILPLPPSKKIIDELAKEMEMRNRFEKLEEKVSRTLELLETMTAAQNKVDEPKEQENEQ